MTMIKNWFGRLRAAFLGVMIIVFALSFMTTACNSDADDELPAGEQPVLTVVQRALGNEQLISLAVCRLLDGKDASSKKSFGGIEKTAYQPLIRLNTNDDTPSYIKYDFDFVQIKDMVRYVAPAINFPFLNETCGEGEIEVLITSFNTFVYADATKDEKHLLPFIGDNLIVFRGDFGIFACMENGGPPALTEYSSHKRFGENSIEKDATPPLYQFFVKTEGDSTSLACEASNVFGVIPNQSSLDWIILQGGDIVGSEDLFSAEELSILSEMSQQCTIIATGENYFEIKGEYNLEKIFFDEYTVFFIGDEQVKSTDFAKGDVVTVSFAKYYEGYDPKAAVANKIAKD